MNGIDCLLPHVWLGGDHGAGGRAEPTLYYVVQPVNPALADAACSRAVPRAVACIRQSRNGPPKRLDDPAIHVRSRIEAGLLLGRLGDARFPVEEIAGVKVIVPPMVAIGSGEAQIGSGFWQRLAQRQADESPRPCGVLGDHSVQYPVTNAEYACFVAAGRAMRRRDVVAGRRAFAAW